MWSLGDTLKPQQMASCCWHNRLGWSMEPLVSLLSPGYCGSVIFYSYSSGLWVRNRVRTDMYMPSAKDMHRLSCSLGIFLKYDSFAKKEPIYYAFCSRYIVSSLLNSILRTAWEGRDWSMLVTKWRGLGSPYWGCLLENSPILLAQLLITPYNKYEY